MDQDKLDLRAQEQARKQALRDKALRQADAAKRKNGPTKTSMAASSKPLSQATEAQSVTKSKKHSKGPKLILRLPKLRLKGKKSWKKLALMIAAIPLILAATIIPDLLKPTRVSAAINLRGTNSGSNTTGTSVNVAPNASTKDGDVMIAVLFNGALPGTVTVPGGWTTIGSTCTSGTGEDRTTMRFYWRKYVTTDTNWTWSWTTSGPYHLSITSYSGVDNTTPIHAVPATFCASGTGTFLAANNITTTLTNTLIVGAFSQGNGNSNTTHTITPSSATERYGYNGGYNYSCGLICTNTKQYEYSYSDSMQATAGTTSRSAFSNVSSPYTATNFALTPATDPSLEQAAYRWLANADSITPGSALAATNTAISNIKLGDVVRLRMLIHVSTAELQVDLLQYKLRYATKVGAACGGGDETFSDVATASGAIRYFNNTNAGATDGATIATTANDPSHSGHTIVAHTYEEANNFATRILTPSGQDAMWDFALTNNSAPNNTTYCFKMTTSADADINTYTVYPELTSINIGYEASAYRWMANADSTTPGSAIAAQDTQATQINTNQNIRLRMLIHNGGTDPIPVGYENLKLQFAVQSGGSCSATPTGSYGDVATAAGDIRYLNNATPSDGATAVTATGDPSHSGHATTFHTYEEANNFTTRVSQPASQDGLWDFALTNFSAPFGTVYCFRAVKAADGSLITNTVYPQITIINPTFEQAAYRWYDNADSTTPGTVRAGNNTPATAIAQTAQFRLRVLLHIASDSILNGTETFKLQFAVRGSDDLCDTAGANETYADVATSSGAVRYHNNTTPGDAAAISTTGSDPSHSAHTIRAQTYEESNNFTSTTTTAAGEDAMWDFSLATVSAPLRTTYCFKVVRSSGSDINTYTTMPQLSIIDPRYELSAYRWLNNADNITPGSAYAANNTIATGVSQNTELRLRILVHISNDASGVGVENFKLRFAQKVGAACDLTSADEVYSDLVQGSGTFRYKDNASVAENASIATTGSDPSHSTDTIVTQTYRESNNFTTITSTPAGQDAMWDFSIVDLTANQNTSWCFKVFKSDNTELNTYTQMPELTTAIAAMSQSAYRWFTNVDTADYLSVGTNPTSGDDKVSDIKVDTANGFIYSVGYEGVTADNRWRIEKRGTNDGALVSGFGGTGCTTNSAGAICSDPTTGDDQAKAVAIDVSGGFMYVVGHDAGVSPATSTEWRIEKRSLSDGSLASGTTSGGFVNGVLLIDPYSNTDQLLAIAIDTTGGHFYLGGYGGVSATNFEIRIEKRALSTGTLVTAFDNDGFITEDLSGTKPDAITSIVLDTANGHAYFGGYSGRPSGANSSLWRVEKRNLGDGALVSGFGNNDAACPDAGSAAGLYCVDPNAGNTDDRVTSLALDSTYLFIAGNDTNGSGQWRVDRITLSNNTISAPLFAVENPTASDDTITTIQSDGTNIYLGGYDGGESPATTREWRYEKRTVAGTLVSAFDGDGILRNDVTSGVDQITAIVIDPGNGFIYGSGYDSAGSNQWRMEKRKTSDGTRGWEPQPYASQDTKSLPGFGVKFRLRMTLHISGENMPVNGESLKLQYAPKSGTCDTGFIGETANFVDIGATGDIAYADNSTAADAAATLPLTSDPVHSGHTNVVQTYEEANPFTFPNAVNSGSDGLWDFALIDNSAFGNYCFRAVKNSDGSVIGATVVPEVAFCDRPKTDNQLRHGSFFCDDSKKKFSWS